MAAQRLDLTGVQRESAFPMKWFILFLFLAGAGGVGWWYWQKEQPIKDGPPVVLANPATVAAPAPVEDPARTELDVIWKQVEAGDNAAAATALTQFSITYAAHPLVWEAKDLLGKLNSKAMFGSGEYPGKRIYSVVSGDTLSKIATKEKTTVDFLLLGNQMDGTLIHIGQPLNVSPTDFQIELDVTNQSVFLHRGDQFFRYYIVQEASTQPAPGETTVTRKMAWTDGKQIAPGAPGYLEAVRWVVLGNGVTLHNAPKDKTADTPPGATYRLSDEAMRELCALLVNGSPVKITAP